jgi:hypothetical protein
MTATGPPLHMQVQSMSAQSRSSPNHKEYLRAFLFSCPGAYDRMMCAYTKANVAGQAAAGSTLGSNLPQQMYLTAILKSSQAAVLRGRTPWFTRHHICVAPRNHHQSCRWRHTVQKHTSLHPDSNKSTQPQQIPKVLLRHHTHHGAGPTNTGTKSGAAPQSPQLSCGCGHPNTNFKG